MTTELDGTRTSRLRLASGRPSLAYTPLEYINVPKTVDRIAYVVEACRGKHVLDLGCYDETALQKQTTREWLHGQIAGVAQSVLGVDNSRKLPPEGIETGPNSYIIKGDISNLSPKLALDRIDIVVAGELIEHLPNSSEFLIYIKKSLPGRDLIVTTPNATSLTNVIIGVFGRESNHHDHLQIYSYKTLNTLLRFAKFDDFQIIPYYMKYTEMMLRSGKYGGVAVNAAQAMVNGVETLFPLLSGGLIGHVRNL